MDGMTALGWLLVFVGALYGSAPIVLLGLMIIGGDRVRTWWH